jgi:DivIVA domain-containing protein
MRWRPSKREEPETPEQTLARLHREAAASQPSPARFTLRRFAGGYNRDAVDTFLARVGSASADEIQAVRFPYGRFSQGYDVHEVDAYLAGLEASRREAEREGEPGPDPA